ncbi:MAG: DUF4258 domain-containing protein [Bacillota bacterium]|nr:DUF4258 domain-containing protein [Bacillota bacterium]
MTRQSSYVRKMAQKGQIHFSDHALERMGERKVLINDTVQAILEGEEIEVQDIGSESDVRVLFQEATDTIPRFYVVVATSYPEVEVVSVCEFKEEAWDWLGKIMARRRKK